MASPYILYLLLPFASAIVLLVLAAFAFRRRRTSGAMAFGLLMLAACEWKLAHGLGLVASGLQLKLFLHNLEYVGVAAVSVAWLAFVVQYTGFGERLSWRKLLFLAALPLLTLVLVWTNGMHGLVWTNRGFERSGPFTTISMDHGPWFWVFAIYCYCLVLSGTLLLISQLLRSSRAYRKQTAAVLVGVVVLWAGNVAYLLNLSPVPYLNPTLLSFPLTGVLFAWSLFRLRLLDVAPVARDILIEKITDGVIVLDNRNRVVDLNLAAERILDLRTPKVLWRPAAEVLPEILPEFSILPASPVSSEVPTNEDARTSSVRSGDADADIVDTERVDLEDNLEVRIGTGEGVRYYERTLSTLDDQNARPGGQPGGRLILLRDVTERRSLEKRLEHQAFYDPLTNLPNRTLLTDRISHAVERVNQRVGVRQVEDRSIEGWHGGYAVAVLFIDLDDFKAVNDSLGHETGDMLLAMAAQRMKDCLRPEDILARLGGDEFVALVEYAQREETIKVAERIVQELERPFYVEGHELFTSASIGISVLDTRSGFARSNTAKDEREGPQGEYLLKEADIAMYQAKERGKTSYAIFEGWMDFRASERLKLSNDLRRAVEHEEFVLQYQPIAHLETGKIEGFEALLRWEHPERGLLLPNEFIHAAEESGLIVPLGRWVLRQATLQAVQWCKNHLDTPPPSVSVNLSPRQFGRSELVEEVEEIVRHAGLDPSLLKLEITESAAMKDVPSTVEALARLRALNIKIFLDDFGAGYSSLGYLTRFPVDALKIDRSIISGLDKNPKKAAVAQAIVTLAHSLEYRVIAEGIETRGQLEHLREFGCELGQGNLLWKPLFPEAAIKLYLRTLEQTPAWVRSGQ